MINATDKNLTIENRLVEKLDLIIDRLKGTDDGVILIDGDEGQGKTNITVGVCYYVAYKTNRHYGIDNIFFDLDEVIKFASSTKEQIIHWDEAALGGMADQWWKKNQQKFIQLLMIARKKRHFIAICIPKFYKLREYLVVDRSIGLIHVYSRQNIHKGRFFYFTKEKKEMLYDEWRRNHKKFYLKYRSFGGSFQEYMKQILSEEQIQQYEDKKDVAILSLNDEVKKDKAQEKIEQLQTIISNMIEQIANKYSISKGELINLSGKSDETIRKWNKKQSNIPVFATPLLQVPTSNPLY